MKIIEQIEIKNFRSFWNRKKSKTQIIKLNELNIFSWSNDSWKSNILRALNLFFNWNTYLDTFLDFKNDFYKKENRDDDDINEEMITIKISFINEENKWKNKNNDFVRLPEKFWVSRKFLKSSRYSSYNQDDWVETSFRSNNEKWIKDITNSVFYEKNKDNKYILKQNVRASLSRQLSIFLDSIYFHYVPAIKDKNYFSYLYWELQRTLLKEKDSELDKTKVNFQESIQKSTEKLMNEFKNVVNNNNININPIFELPDLVDLFKSLDLNTWKVELKYRWDWIQAKLIPEILNFISVKEQTIKSSNIKKWEKPKKYFIWWFEEPENSYEYRNAQILADKFRDTFVNNSQIFITTHSFNFLSINTSQTSIYRVWKDLNIESSRVLKVKNISWNFIPDQNYDEESFDLLNDELWFLSLNNELEKLYKEKEEQNKQLLIESSELKGKIKEIEVLKPNKVFICEDKNWPKIWEHFFTKYWINVDKIISAEWCTKFDWEDWFLKTNYLSKNPNLKIFRQNDRDWLNQERINYIETNIKTRYNKINYKFTHLPVNEIENFYILTDDYFSDELIDNEKMNLELEFSWTFQTNFLKYSKDYWDYLFKNQDQNKIFTKCRQEADLNIKKYYPWKDIKKLKENLNIEREILKWELSDFPQELNDYLEEIKIFFNT